MQFVRQPEQKIVLLGIVQIEDVLGEDVYFPDHCAGGLEFGERRHRNRVWGIVRHGRQAQEECGGPAAKPAQRAIAKGNETYSRSVRHRAGLEVTPALDSGCMHVHEFAARRPCIGIPECMHWPRADALDPVKRLRGCSAAALCPAQSQPKREDAKDSLQYPLEGYAKGRKGNQDKKIESVQPQAGMYRISPNLSSCSKYPFCFALLCVILRTPQGGIKVNPLR